MIFQTFSDLNVQKSSLPSFKYSTNCPKMNCQELTFLGEFQKFKTM